MKILMDFFCSPVCAITVMVALLSLRLFENHDIGCLVEIQDKISTENVKRVANNLKELPTFSRN